jgi:N-methylhydantoinase A
MPAPLVMQSSGGVVGIEDASERAAACVLSGPSGGVVGAAFVARAGGHEDLLTLDMGGTSTDVAPVIGGETQTTTEAVIAGVPIRFPMIDVHSVSAGGGSIAWIDEGGALRVGPHSAGADPGPASYAKGGEEATVTDANLWLGYLAEDARLGGEVQLVRGRAEKALSAIGERLDMDVLAVALGVVRVANAEMVRALRVISVERGLDPRDFALAAFGGAGPMHACALAEELGIGTVLVPKASGVLSALGLAISDVRRDYVSPFLSPLGDVDARELDIAFEQMETEASKDLEGPRCRRRADVRYRGQSFELTVDADDVEALPERFHDAHEHRYGYRMDDEPLELVNVRVVAAIATEAPRLREREDTGEPARASRRANFEGEWMEVAVLDRARLGRGARVAGPVLVEFAEATCVVWPGWSGEIDEVGTLVLERRGD